MIEINTEDLILLKTKWKRIYSDIDNCTGLLHNLGFQMVDDSAFFSLEITKEIIEALADVEKKMTILSEDAYEMADSFRDAAENFENVSKSIAANSEQITEIKV